MIEHPGLRVEYDGDAVVTVTLSNPDRRNVQAPSMWAALNQVARTLDPAVRVVVLRAEGPDFSAGLDRKMLSLDGAPGEPNLLAAARESAATVGDEIAEFQRGFTCWGECPAIVLAAVQGHAIGAGFQLALAADLRIVANDVKFAMRETSLGLVPDLGGTLPLVRTLGYSRALEICLTGRFVEAAEAVNSGLASLAVPENKLVEVTEQVVDAILEAPREASRELKALLRNAIEATPADQLRDERETQARLLHAIASPTQG